MILAVGETFNPKSTNLSYEAIYLSRYNESFSLPMSEIYLEIIHEKID